jgi:thiamine-phosphate pyrophosphorylase
MTDKLARAKLARAANRLSMQSGSALPALVLLTDDERLADPIAATHALPRGSMVILRARDGAQRANLAATLLPLMRTRKIKLLIANDAGLAVRIGADGIHLPQRQARDATHWRALHPGWIITAAAHALSAIHVKHVDALFVAPVFATQSHPDKQHLGPLRLRLIAQQSRVPVYALGGINATTAEQLSGAKLAGLGAIGALAV